MLSRDLTKFTTLGLIFLYITSAIKSETVNLAGSGVKLGVDCLEDEDFALLKGKKIGLITNQSGVSSEGLKTRIILANSDNVDLVASKDFASVYNNVFLDSQGSSLKADKIDYDFDKKIYKVSMYSSEKVKIKLVE